MINQLELRQEEKHLQYVLQVISHQIEHQQGKTRGLRNALRSGSANDYNDEVHWNWSVRSTSQALDNLKKLAQVPYFGRIDFREDIAPAEERIYIGQFSLYDQDCGIVIYDWRAPVCSMFYRHEVGIASYVAPVGEIRGEILLKRHYEIANGALLSVHDSSTPSSNEVDIVTEDEMLLSILGANTSDKMRQIVRTIQAEQDIVIRSDNDTLVVQGPAGSGKTIVALHRAAFLLYQFRSQRRNISANQMLVLSPNRVFSDYISRVLPDLGEGNIAQMVLDEYARGELRKVQGAGYSLESKTDQYEYVLASERSIEYEVRTASMRLKSSPAMIHLVEEISDRMADEFALALTDIYYPPSVQLAGTERVLVSGANLRDRFSACRRRLSIIESAELVLGEVRQQVRDYQAETKQRLSYAEKASLDQQVRRLELQVAGWKGEDLVERYLSIWDAKGQSLESIQPYQIPSCMEDICAYTRAAIRRGIVPYEDIVPILLLHGLYNGFPKIDRVKHVVIDEAQDYSSVEYEFLRNCLTDSPGYTVVGDINQSVNPYGNIQDYDGLGRIINSSTARLILTKSYRSCYEITEFARHILGPDTIIQNVRRSGLKPILVKVRRRKDMPSTTAGIIRDAQSRGMRSVAVICKSYAECEAAYDMLSREVPVALVTKKTDRIDGEILLMPPYLAKGLEFDAVIVYQAGEHSYRGDRERRLLYTICTRALHELHVLYSGRLTPLIPVKREDLYDSRIAPSRLEADLVNALAEEPSADHMRILFPEDSDEEDAEEAIRLVHLHLKDHHGKPMLMSFWFLAELCNGELNHESLLEIFREATKLCAGTQQNVSKNSFGLICYCLGFASARGHHILANHMVDYLLRTITDRSMLRELLRFTSGPLKAGIAWRMLGEINQKLESLFIESVR